MPFSAEPPSQKATGETHCSNTTRATKRNLLTGNFAQPRSPGASSNSQRPCFPLPHQRPARAWRHRCCRFFAYIEKRVASLAYLIFPTALRGNPPLLFYRLCFHHFTLSTHIAASNLAVRLKDFVVARSTRAYSRSRAFAQAVP
jgi:hypothetical protein